MYDENESTSLLDCSCISILYKYLKYFFNKIEYCGGILNIICGILWNGYAIYQSNFIDATCSPNISYWLMIVAYVGWLQIIIASFGMCFVNWGKFMSYDKSYELRMARLEDAGIDLVDDEDPRTNDPLEDPGQIIYEQVNMGAAEQLYTLVLKVSATMGFIFSIFFIIWIPLGHLFWVEAVNLNCPVASTNIIFYILLLWDSAIFIFLYKRFRG